MSYVFGIGVMIVFEDGYFVMLLMVGNCVLLDGLNCVNCDMGLLVMVLFDLLKCGVGDIVFVVVDVDGLVGFGMLSSGDYVLGEIVDLESICC